MNLLLACLVAAVCFTGGFAQEPDASGKIVTFPPPVSSPPPPAPSPPPPSPPSPPPPPAPTPVTGGCRGLALGAIFQGYTNETFNVTQRTAFCKDLKAATDWNAADLVCDIRGVYAYPTVAFPPAVLVTAYLYYEVSSAGNPDANVITSIFRRDLLLNRLAQPSELEKVFADLKIGSIVVGFDCNTYASFPNVTIPAPGLPCDNTNVFCTATAAGCFADSVGAPYQTFLYPDTFTCNFKAPPPSPSPSPSPPPVPSPSPSPSPSPVPSPATPPPPPAPLACTYIGTGFRFRSTTCGSTLPKYIAASANCENNSVKLRTTKQVQGDLIRFKLNTTSLGATGTPSAITSHRNCTTATLTSPPGDRQPTLGGTSWRYSIVPAGEKACNVVNLIAPRRQATPGAGIYLAANAACDGFTWSTDGSGAAAQWRVVWAQI